MTLSPDEREKFLAEPHTASVSVHLDASRGPMTVPIWYQYVPGGEPWIMSGAETRKTKAIEAAGCFTLMVQRLEPTRRYVAVGGAVTRIETATQDEINELCYRYLDGDAAERHVDFLKRRGENLVISMRPEHWLAADKGAF
ncbi:pyridoxamine 5'-phosphate oxidase family protein [Spirillospora sp. CA-255316]